MSTPVITSSRTLDRATTAADSTPRYSLLVSSDAEHRLAAQRLRAEVFGSEPGFRLPADADGLDADRFDEHCDHLLVRHEGTGDVVGCYRMMTPEGADRAGGYYTATEFDISALSPRSRRVVEMGRACVREEHRSGTVLGLMWSGILRYLDLTGHDTVMGCVSVPLDSGDGHQPGAHVRGVQSMVSSGRYAYPEAVVPYTPVVLGGTPLADIAAPARPTVPPLLRGYLRIGARLCSEPAMDLDFGVADFVAVLTMAEANVRYLDRLRAAAAAFEHPAGTPAGTASDR